MKYECNSTCIQCRTWIDFAAKGALALCHRLIHLAVLPSVTEGKFPCLCCYELQSSLLGKKDGIQDKRVHKGPCRGLATRAPITASAVCILILTQLSVTHTRTHTRKHLPLYTDPVCKRNKNMSSCPWGYLSGLIPGPCSPHPEKNKKPEPQMSTKAAS